MRIYDGEADRTLHHVTILLTREEIDDFLAHLRPMRKEAMGTERNVHALPNPIHEHVKEVQLCLYQEGSVPEGWSPRFARIIERNE